VGCGVTGRPAGVSLAKDKCDFPSPEHAESDVVPADHCVRFDDDQDLLPSGPRFAHEHPEKLVWRAHSRVRLFLFVDGELRSARCSRAKSFRDWKSERKVRRHVFTRRKMDPIMARSSGEGSASARMPTSNSLKSRTDQ